MMPLSSQCLIVLGLTPERSARLPTVRNRSLSAAGRRRSRSCGSPTFFDLLDLLGPVAEVGQLPDLDGPFDGGGREKGRPVVGEAGRPQELVLDPAGQDRLGQARPARQVLEGEDVFIHIHTCTYKNIILIIILYV